MSANNSTLAPGIPKVPGTRHGTFSLCLSIFPLFCLHVCSPVYISNYLSVCLFFYLTIFICLPISYVSAICLLVCQFIILSDSMLLFYLLVCLSCWLSIYLPPVCLSFRLSINLIVCLSFWLSTCLPPVCLFLCLYEYLSIS